MNRLHAVFSILAILLVAGAPILAARAAASAPGFGVLARHCDDRGGVDGLLIQVEGPGTITLQWSNAKQCGTPI